MYFVLRNTLFTNASLQGQGQGQWLSNRGKDHCLPRNWSISLYILAIHSKVFPAETGVQILEKWTRIILAAIHPLLCLPGSEGTNYMIAGLTEFDCIITVIFLVLATSLYSFWCCRIGMKPPDINVVFSPVMEIFCKIVCASFCLIITYLLPSFTIIPPFTYSAWKYLERV